MIWLGGENSLWGGSFHLRPRSTCRAAAEAENGWSPIFFLSHQIQRPLQCIVLPPGTLRGVCLRLWSRGPAAAEAPRRVRSRGSHIDLADGLEMGSPYFHLYSPGLALSRGGSLSCSSSPLSESALICSSFSPRRFICFVPCRGNARIMVILGSFMHFQTVFTCLGVWLQLILNN